MIGVRVSAHGGSAFPNARTSGPTAMHFIVPGGCLFGQVGRGSPSTGSGRSYGPALVIFRKTNPGHRISAHLRDDATGIVEQTQFVLGLNHSSATGRKQTQGPGSSPQFSFTVYRCADIADDAGPVPLSFRL